MAKLHAYREERPVENQPVNLGDRAIDNLKFIRETMERSTHFTAVPGYGGMLMGVTAIGAAYIASQQPTFADWLVVWLTEAALAFAIGVLAMWQKSKTDRFVACLGPGQEVRLRVRTVADLRRRDHARTLEIRAFRSDGSGLDAALRCGGRHRRGVLGENRPDHGLGVHRRSAASHSRCRPSTAIILMGASFGLTHIVFGAIIARRYGG